MSVVLESLSCLREGETLVFAIEPQEDEEGQNYTSCILDTNGKAVVGVSTDVLDGLDNFERLTVDMLQEHRRSALKGDGR